ncbi:hypothetical protein G3489_19255, partial [Shewanella baltica]|uniref:hypothetical protein n=1 Tax=Shewanella baltica TaxID=62322 RepID=UPI00217D2102
TNGYFDLVSANTVAGTKGQFTNLNATGTTTLNTVTANSGTIKTFYSDIATIGLGNIDVLRSDDLRSSKTATFGSLDSDQITTNTFIGKSVTANSGQVSGNANVVELVGNNLIVKNKLQTKDFVGSSSVLGSATASSLSVSNQLTAIGVNVSSAIINTASIGSVSGSGFSYKTVTASQYNGGSFNATDDFYTPVSSVDNNYLLITEQKSKLDNCMNVTKYCIPDVPVVSLSCAGCISQAARDSFSAIATGNIQQCRQGCSYQWVNSGTGLVFSACNSGIVPKGGSANPSCRISASLGPQESANGSVKLVVTNAHYSSKSSEGSANISYQNTTANDPFANVRAGCWIDTAAFDTVQRGHCLAIIHKDSTIVYSVGDDISPTHERYVFSKPSEWTISITGACTTTSYTCDRKIPKPNRPMNYPVTMVVTHKPTGKTLTFSVTGSVEDGK